eukprot:GCRY01006285.1.p1 GENE.GCRY01006285.1~~GCRY01006285.1.p1  ORF type:complete len:168 (+),score=14.11 GCRY01006285.1:145-648(+)
METCKNTTQENDVRIITVSSSDGKHFCVWNPKDCQSLRSIHRILGYFSGSTSSVENYSLPLTLFKEEVLYCLFKEIIHVFDDSIPHSLPSQQVQNAYFLEAEFDQLQQVQNILCMRERQKKKRKMSSTQTNESKPLEDHQDMKEREREYCDYLRRNNTLVRIPMSVC